MDGVADTSDLIVSELIELRSTPVCLDFRILGATLAFSSVPSLEVVPPSARSCAISQPKDLMRHEVGTH